VREARSTKTLAAARVFVGFVDLRDFVIQTSAARGATPQANENGIFSIILGSTTVTADHRGGNREDAKSLLRFASWPPSDFAFLLCRSSTN